MITKGVIHRSRSLRSKAATVWMGCCLFAALFAPFLANDLPLYARYDNVIYFPAWNPAELVRLRGTDSAPASQVKWNDLEGARLVWPLIPYSPASTDLHNTGFVSPFGVQHYVQYGHELPMPAGRRHWLGTTQTGQDVLSGILHGARLSLAIGFISILIAGFLGILIGGWSGYAGDRGYRVRRPVFWMLLAGILPAWFYGFSLRADNLADSFRAGPGSFLLSLSLSLIAFSIVLILFVMTGRALSNFRLLKGSMRLPVDLLLSRLSEIFSTLPRLVLIITLSALTRPSLVNLVLIFGLTGWTDLARLVRAEMLKIRGSDYMAAAQGQGLSSARILIRHALPNVAPVALSAMLLGVAGIILAESSLSFLGIGVPFDAVTWGSLIASGKENFSAWWVVVFPGLAIFFTLASLNALAAEYRKR